MGTTEILNNDARVSFSGSWAFTANAAASSPSGYNKSTTSGNICTITFTGRALYLYAFCWNGGGQFDITLDGVSYPGYRSCGTANVNGNFLRYLIPICRGLTDTTHTVILTVDNSISGASGLTVDSFLAITGSRVTPIAGNLTCIGDSISFPNGTGPYQKGSGYIYQLQQQLSMLTKQSINFIAAGDNGDMLIGQDGTHPGGNRKVFTKAIANACQFTTLFYGANDFGIIYNTNANGFADYFKQQQAICCLLEDSMDISQCIVAMATPSYMTPYWQRPSTTQTPVSCSASALEVAVEQMAHLAVQFPWLRIAHVYEAMDRRGFMVQPNSNDSYGLHPNDQGHMLIANELCSALLGLSFDAQSVVGAGYGVRM
jgi:hypothetical protein